MQFVNTTIDSLHTTITAAFNILNDNYQAYVPTSLAVVTEAASSIFASQDENSNTATTNYGLWIATALTSTLLLASTFLFFRRRTPAPQLASTPTVLTFSSIEDFKARLKSYGIDCDSWNVKPETLFEEIQKGEATLEVQDGTVVRKVSVVSVRCFYTDHNGKRYYLNEDKQILANGDERVRPYDFVSETMKPGETIEEAAVRALSEELDTRDSRLEFIRLPEQDRTRESKGDAVRGYPGITSKYNIYFFKTDIPEDVVKKEGYVDRDEEAHITSYFKWHRVQT